MAAPMSSAATGTSATALLVQRLLQARGPIPDAKIEHDELQQIMHHRDVNCKTLGDNLRSVNFADRAFYKARWDDLSIQARGLFVEEALDTGTNRRLSRVCGRSYRKFFYQDERGVTYMQRGNLPTLINFPVTAYVKENGYLGILFARRRSDGTPYLQPASKSTITGDFAGMFAQLLNQHLSANNINPTELAGVLAETNSSVVFEVIHPTFDPHIIRYKEPHMVLLECISNQISKFETQPFDNLRALAEHFHFQLKVPAGTLHNMQEYDELHNKLTHHENFRVNGELVEGLVLEDMGKFMIKVKSLYYNTWKRLRTLKDVARRGKPVRISADDSPTIGKVIHWLQRPENRKLLDQDIITIRSVYLGELDTATAMMRAPEKRFGSDEEGDDADEGPAVAGPSAAPQIADSPSPLGEKIRAFKDALHKNPVCVVILGPPHVGQEALARTLANKLDGTVIAFDKHVKSTLLSAYYSGKPAFLPANEVVLLKLWPTVLAANETVGFRFVGVVYEMSDELPLVCIKNAIATLQIHDDGKANKEQSLHHAILHSCKRLEAALNTTQASPLKTWMGQTFAENGMTRLQLLPDSVKSISEETKADIEAARSMNDIAIRDEITQNLPSTNAMMELVCDGLLPTLSAAAIPDKRNDARITMITQSVRDAVFHGRVPSLKNLTSDEEKRFALWLTVAGLTQNDLLRQLSPSQYDLHERFLTGTLPLHASCAPVLLLLVGLPGLGKTFVSSILSRALQIKRICQDEEGNRDKFLTAIMRELKLNGIVFADRNNHTASHRHAVIEAVKKKHPTALVVCISFAVDNVKETLAMCAARIEARGEAHPSLRASSEYKAVLHRFGQSYEPPVWYSREPGQAPQWHIPANPVEDSDFLIDHLIRVDPRQPEQEKLHSLVVELSRVLASNDHAPALKDLANAEALVARALPASEQAGPSSAASLIEPMAALATSPTRARTPSPAVSPGGGKKERIPWYYAMEVEKGDVASILKGTAQGIQSLSVYGNHFLNPHVTLLFLGKSIALNEHDEKLRTFLAASVEQKVEIEATHLLQNKRGACLAVRIAPEWYDERRQNQAATKPGMPTHHITLATSNNNIPAKYSNDLVDSAFFSEDNPEQVQIIPITPPRRLRVCVKAYSGPSN